MKHFLPLSLASGTLTLLLSIPAAAQSGPGSDGAGRNLLLDPAVKEVRVLSQNWSDALASEFYNTTQGSQMMPYQWFLSLEQAESPERYLDPAHIRKIGYIPRVPAPGNADGLPIGFVKNPDGKGNFYMGLTCAACHTGLIQKDKIAWLIDGGPTMANAQEFLHTLETALRATSTDSAKFDRFATQILGVNPAADAKARLHVELDELIQRRAGYNQRNFPSDPQLASGPGRLDAFDAIFNEVAVRFAQVPDAPTFCNAPVSYPFLWDTPQHDRVQWNGSAENVEILGQHIGALGRNIGEVIGVFADVDTTKEKPPIGGYPSSVRTDNLEALEELLRGLWSPEWPEAAFKPIDNNLAGIGHTLFKKYCNDCHLDIDRTEKNRKIVAQMRNVQTDPTMATNAATRKTPSGIFKGRGWLDGKTPKILKAEEPVAHLLQHLGQRVLIGAQKIEEKDAGLYKYDVMSEIELEGSKVTAILSDVRVVGGVLKTATVKAAKLFDKDKGIQLKDGVDLKGVIPKLKNDFKVFIEDAKGKITTFKASGEGPASSGLAYKARPLNGIWATAPYLHNGSVLNLDELLKPAEKRLQTFKVGTIEFDSEHVGFLDAGEYLFDTARPGNSNAGHDKYRENKTGPLKVFSDDERAALVEYMKTL